MSAMQEDCIHGRTVLVLCHPANTWNLSENCNLFSSTTLKRMTGFCHSKLLQSWTKIYASKARTSKIWALLNLQLPKKRVSRKHLPTHSLPYDSRYLRFVTETQAAPSCDTWSCHQDYISFITAVLMSYCHHCNWKCRIPDVDAYGTVTGRRRLWNESPWYLHEKTLPTLRQKAECLKALQVCHWALWNHKRLLYNGISFLFITIKNFYSVKRRLQM